MSAILQTRKRRAQKKEGGETFSCSLPKLQPCSSAGLQPAPSKYRDRRCGWLKEWRRSVRPPRWAGVEKQRFPTRWPGSSRPCRSMGHGYGPRQGQLRGNPFLQRFVCPVLKAHGVLSRPSSYAHLSLLSHCPWLAGRATCVWATPGPPFHVSDGDS